MSAPRVLPCAHLENRVPRASPHGAVRRVPGGYCNPLSTAFIGGPSAKSRASAMVIRISLLNWQFGAMTLLIKFCATRFLMRMLRFAPTSSMPAAAR
jgi:hypothetical protein